MAKASESTRHRWGEPDRMAMKTERECVRGCGTIRVTFHQGGRHWVEFYRDGEKCEGTHTPICMPVKVPA